MFQLAEYFGNNMMLQRRKPIRLWGNCDNAGSIRVFFNDKLVLQEEIREGEFSIFLPEQEAIENATLRLVHLEAEEEIFISNVDIGEVWLAGGQSNMEFLLKYDKESDEMIANAQDEHFRFYDVGEWAYQGERELGRKDAKSWDRWMTFNPETAGAFSAVATYFALRLRKELGVPVGIIGCNWGGTSASAWIPRKELEKHDDLQVYIERFEKDIQGVDMEKYVESLKTPNSFTSNPKVAEELEKRKKNEMLSKPGLLTRVLEKFFKARSKMMPYSEYRPGGLYETMLKPVAGYTIAGFLWYQGESDYDNAGVYDKLLGLVIQTWRKDWNENLPFIITQLTAYEGWTECSGDNYHIIREQQQKLADTVENVYMASIMDVGSRYDIHPKEKRPVGERLAALALNYVYKKVTPCEAPRMEKIMRENEKIYVRFANTEKGLVAKGDITSLFEVRVNNKVIPVSAKVQGDVVVLEGKGLDQGKAEISFAYRPWCPMTLFNSLNFAARPNGPMKEV